MEWHVQQIIGVSLTKPHTSGTALRTSACMLACLWPFTVNSNLVHLSVSQRLNMLIRSVERHSEGLLPECSVDWKKPRAKTTQVEACTATYVRLVYYKLSQLRTMTDKLCSRPLTDGTHGSWGCLSNAHAQTMLIKGRDSCSWWLGVKFTKCMCNHSSCPDWQQTVTNPQCCYSRFVYHDITQCACSCSPHDD